MKLHSQLLTMRGIATAFTAVALSVSTGISADAAIWTGGTGSEFSTAANWDDGLVPASNSTQDIKNGDTVERSVDSIAGRTFVSGNSTLNITGGTHSDNRSGNTIRNFVGRGSLGIVNQSGGTMDIGHAISIGGGGTNGNGTYSLTDGALIVSRGSNGANLGDAGGFSIEVGGNAGGDGLFEVSGGSIATRIGVGIGGTGTFSVLGSGATSIGIGSNGSIDGKWNQYLDGVLAASVDAGGLTSIFIDDVDATLGVSVEFQAGSVLDLNFLSIPETPGTWTVLEAENSAIVDLGLVLSAATATGWSFDVDNSGTNGLLTATYAVPEPTTVGLLVLGGLCLVRRRTV